MWRKDCDKLARLANRVDELEEKNRRYDDPAYGVLKTIQGLLNAKFNAEKVGCFTPSEVDLVLVERFITEYREEQDE